MMTSLKERNGGMNRMSIQVADVLLMLRRERESAAIVLLKIATAVSRRLPQPLRQAGSDSIGEAVFRILEKEGEGLRRAAPGASAGALLYRWLYNIARNSVRTERRERERRRHAVATRESATTVNCCEAPDEPAATLPDKIRAAAVAARVDGGLAARRLTFRQWQMLRGIERGLGRLRLAHELGIKPSSVRDHLRALLDRLLKPPLRVSKPADDLELRTVSLLAQGNSVASVAELTGVTPRTVRARARRAAGGLRPTPP
jgi:DNA-binding NarL/FixJ family response regulator